MSRNGKVIVAMSGGVDSSVAACMLKEKGYECIGVFMRVGAHTADECAAPSDETGRMKHGCSTTSDVIDAKTIAGKLGIPFRVLDFRPDFENIIGYFVDEYARGRTPNPCVMCNINLKFGKMLDYADQCDAQFIATGHYARVLEHDGRPVLSRSLNPAKDQSYVLFGIRRDNLHRCIFPLGEMTDKTRVREIAADLGLRVHDKPDSQEICFVPDDDYRTLVAERRPETKIPGDVVDIDGNIVGRHDGITSFTIGQRRGLGIAMGHPIYITRIDADTNTVEVGPRERLFSTGLKACNLNWLTDPPTAPTAVDIKIRHQHRPTSGTLIVNDEGTVSATFETPQLAVTPGQAAVFYDKKGTVLGGGWIDSPLA